MTTALLWLSTALIAAVVTRRVTREIVRAAPLPTRNYRGLEIPAVAGAAIVVAILTALGWIAALRAIADESALLRAAARDGIRFAVVVLGFGFLGLWDDLTGRMGERGWRAHLRSLVRGRPTAGALKLLGGSALAVVVVSPRRAGLVWTLADAAVVALAANAINLLDVRPGRAGKGALIALAPMIVLDAAAAPALVGAGAAVLAFLPDDLRERGMLGDTGANAVGGLVGYAIVATGADAARLIALAVLVGLHVVADQPGLSRGIERVGALRRLDRLGRVAG